MKCQQCERQATFHITELTGPEGAREFNELHLCEHHAKSYLAQDATQAAGPTLAGALAKHLQVGKAAEELERLDQKACPVCGITFYEFRHVGRLGCPHDYDFFAKDLGPLIANIHGDSTHKGKRPKHGGAGTEEQTQLIRLRREMEEATEREDYEAAARCRDEIRRIEKKGRAEGAGNL